DDHADDPLLAVMAAIEATVENDSSLNASTKKLVRSLGIVSGQVAAVAAKGIVKQLGKRLVGEEFEEVMRVVANATGLSGKEISNEAEKEIAQAWDEESKSLLSKFKQNKKTVGEFQGFLEKFVGQLRDQKRSPLFVLIDELDRCRPPYALALLERVKHLFD